MKILLTQDFEARHTETPIALLDLAAYGRKVGYSVDVAYHDDVPVLKSYDCIGFSTLILGQNTLASLDKLHRRYDGVLVLGGKGTASISNRHRAFLSDLGITIHVGHGELLLAPPPVDYETYPPWNIDDFRTLDKAGTMTMLMSSRGCPYHCHFCHNTEPKVNYFSPERTVANAALMLNALGKSRIFFVDDIFALRADKMLAILEAADKIKFNLRQRTSFFIHINHLGDRQLEAISAFQPAEMQVGIESGDDGMLGAMGKTFTADEAADKLRLLHGRGHAVACLFLMGFPGETRGSLQATVDFALRNRQYMSGSWVSFFQPVPGTKGWEMATERLGGAPPIGDWNTNISYLDPNLTETDLADARKAIMGN